MLPLSVTRSTFERRPDLAGCRKQKFCTTSMIQKSLSPVAASMIFSVVGSSMRVVYLTLARMEMMSFAWYCTVRAVVSAMADAIRHTTSKALARYFIFVNSVLGLMV